MEMEMENGMSVKMECKPKYNVTQNQISLKMKCQ